MTNIFLDIETGGFNKKKDAICEIAMVVTDDNCIPISEYQRYIRPYYQETGEPVRYKEDAMVINGLSVGTLAKEGDQIEYVLREIKEFVNRYATPITFIGQNAIQFDFPFVQYLFDRFYPEFDLNHYPWEDTKIIAKKLLETDSYSLSSLCEIFRIKNNKAHSALSDVYATIEVYKNLMSI